MRLRTRVRFPPSPSLWLLACAVALLRSDSLCCGDGCWRRSTSWDDLAMPGTVLVPSTVLTMDARNSRADAVGVLDGRIAAVGSTAEVTAALGEGAARVELDGLCLLPGFIDAHHHYCLAAF